MRINQGMTGCWKCGVPTEQLHPFPAMDAEVVCWDPTDPPHELHHLKSRQVGEYCIVFRAVANPPQIGYPGLAQSEFWLDDRVARIRANIPH